MRDVVTAALPVLACFLGGATAKWAEAIVVVVFALLLLAAPPRFSLGPAANLMLGGLALCGALAFLPADWFFQPLWRAALVRDFEIALAGSATAQPWITASCYASFLIGLAWFYYVATQRLEVRSIRRQFRFFTAAVIALALLCILLYWQNSALPFWHNARGFGPFPNRNQTANLFGLTALIALACAHDDLRQKKPRGILWLVGFALLATALILNFSRAGILLLLVGSALWIAYLVIRTRAAGTIAIGLSALLALGTGLLIFGGATLERFNLRSAQATDISGEFRWLIFQDTMRMIRDTPWVGLGLGNFEPVFAIFRDASHAHTRSLHPESDWLWLWSEAGLPAVLLIVAVALLLACRVFPLAEGTAQRFRLAALICGLLFALHGLVDVAGHRVGSAFAGLFLFGLALRRPAEEQASRWLLIFFRSAGLLFLALGLYWLSAAYRQVSIPGSMGVENELRLAKSANVGRLFRQTITHADRGLGWAPLEWQLYFLRGLGKVGANAPPASALADFRRARFLEPISFEVPYQEGVVWLRVQPALATTAWREALRRARGERRDLYGRMLSRAEGSDQRVKKMLVEASAREPDLVLVYLERAYGDDFRSALAMLLAPDPALEKLSALERTRVFALWAERGDRIQLEAHLAAHPHLLEFGWQAKANDRAKAGDFRGAYELAQKFAPRPALPQTAEGSATPELLQKALLANPGDYLAALQLYRQQMSAGKINDALITIRRLTEKPEVPAYFHFLEAEAWAAAENWEAAWKAWQAYAQTAGR